MSTQYTPGPWHVTDYRNAGLRYRVQRVKWADFAGVCLTLDRQKFWTRAGAEKRAAELRDTEAKKGEA